MGLNPFFMIAAIFIGIELFGVTGKIKGLIQKTKGLGEGFVVFGRFAMTCCADDVQYMGFYHQGRHIFHIKGKCFIVYYIYRLKNNFPVKTYLF